MLQPLHQLGLGLGDAEGTSSPPAAGMDPAGLTATLSTPTSAALPRGYQLPAPLSPGDGASRGQTSCYTCGRQVPASLYPRASLQREHCWCRNRLSTSHTIFLALFFSQCFSTRQLLGPRVKMLAQPCHLHVQLEWSQHRVAEVTSRLPP